VKLPRHLIEAIARACPDDAEAERVMREWQRALPQLNGASERIRAQVAAAQCRCELPARVEHGRCTRCFGRRG
jgi:hypothetical protein